MKPRTFSERRFFRLFLSALMAAQMVLSTLLTQSLPTVQAASTPPILVVVNSAYSANPFGNYLGEILRAEGLNDYEIKDLSGLTLSDLTSHQVTILAETPLLSPQATLFTTYVAGGGRLIAMRPDAQIKSLFGLGTAAGSQTDGYLKLNTTQPVAQGLTSSLLQIHGKTDQYSVGSGAVTVATLYTGTILTAYPAVVLSSTVAAFTYDLVRNVVYTRQGNPANANKIYGSPAITDSQGISGTWDPANPPVTRTTSLFQLSNVLTATAWVDRDLIPIPQADEQQRLLARLVQQLLTGVEPLPQLWYFPGTAKTMLILTGDAHGNPTSYYTGEVSSLASYGAQMTFYPAIASDPPESNVQNWLAQGNTFGIHPYATNPAANLSDGYTQAENWFSSQYPSITRSATVRNHQFAWQGWTDAADLEASYGIGLDVSFANFGTWLQKADGTWPHGYMTGSGQPMKFVRVDGTIAPVYQQLTELADEQLMGLDVGIPEENLTTGQATAVTRQMIDASLAGDYAALTALWHVDYYAAYAQAWAEATMAYANSKGVPMWNADQWLNFTQVRHDADYSNLVWNSGSRTLSFSQTATTTVGLTLTTALPLSYGGYGLSSVTMDSSPYTFTAQTISGQGTAFISASAGPHTFSATYNGPLPGGSSGQSSYGDFAQSCATFNNTYVSDANGGQVRLVGNFRDDFTATTLNTSEWISGTWPVGGSYNPTFGSSELTLPPHGWIRSNGTFAYGAIDAVADFGNGASQHIGFATANFDTTNNGFLFFSTKGGDGNLYARVTNGGEQSLNLGAIPTGLHRYRLEWQPADLTNDVASFYIDGGFVYSSTVTHAGIENLYYFMSNDGSAALNVDLAQVTPTYVGSGSYTSCVFDAGVNMVWQNISWDAITLNGTLTLQTRTSFDGITWSGWSTVSTNGGPILAGARFVQYLLQLATSNSNYTPQVNSVTLSYGPSAVQFSEAAAPSIAAIGQALNYTLTVTVPQTTTYGMVITETLPTGMLYSDFSWALNGITTNPAFSRSGPTDGSGPVNLTWNFGNAVFTNTVGTLTFQGKVANIAGNQGGTLLTSTGGLTHNNSFGAPQTPLNTTSSFTVIEPVMNLAKTVTPNQAAASDVVTFTLVMSNTGTASAYDVGVQDPLPVAKFDSVTVVTTPTGFTFSKLVSGTNTLVGFSGGTLSPAQLANFVFTATLASGVVPGDVLTNTATITQATTLPGSDPNERNEPPVSASALLTVTAPDLAAGITDNLSEVVPGQVYVYNLTITNTGQHPATGVVVSDTLSPNLIFQSATAGVTQAGSVLTWTLSSLNGLGATAPYTVAVQVINVAPAGTKVITNTVNVRDDGLHGPDLTPSDNTMTESDQLNAAPDLAVTKSDGGVMAVPGAQLMYTITYTNTGNIGSTNLLITDSVPVYSTFVAGASSPGWHASSVNAGTPITASVSQLAGGGAHGTLTYTVLVANPVPAGGGPLSVANTVSIGDDGTNGADSNPFNNTGNATTSINAAPDLQITKTDGVTSATPGGLLTYTLNITNTGNQDAANVVITDSLPVSVTFQSATGNVNPDANNVLTWTQASLAGGAGTAQYAVTVRVANPVGAGTSQLVNRAGVSATGTIVSLASDTDSVTAAPNLAVTKTDGVTTATPGGLLTYTLNITNTGNQDAANVVITDSLPVSVTFQSATGNVNPDANNVLTWTQASLAGGGGTAQYAVTVRVANPMGAGISQLVNRAGVSATRTGVSLASDTDTVTAAPSLQITKTDGVTNATPGDLLTYTLNITNTGNQDAANVVITDSLPVSVTIQSATGGATPDANNVLTWHQASLAGGGGTAQYAVTVRVANPVGAISQLVNRAGVSATGTGVSLASDTDSVVNAAPNLEITKTDGVTTATPGGLLTYTLNITNTGNQDAANVVITDSLPVSVTFQSATGGVTPDGNSVLTWNRTSLAGGGGTAQYAVTVRVANSVGAGISQLVNRAGASAAGTIVSLASDTDSVTAAADVGITLAGPITVNPGGTITYTLVYSNSGNRDTAGVTLTETVPLSTTFDAADSTAGKWNCPDGSGAGTTCLDTVGPLPGNGGSGTVLFAVRVAPLLPTGTTAITDTASIGDNGGSGADQTPADNSQTYVIPVNQAPDMGVAVQVTPVFFMPGQLLTYTIVYSNAGVGVATGVVITASIPTSTTLISTGWNCLASTCTKSVGDVAGGGAGGTVSLAVRVWSPWPKGGPAISETVTIGDAPTNLPDWHPSNNVVTVVTTGGGWTIYLPLFRR